jgi:hypothetical protein
MPGDAVYCGDARRSDAPQVELVDANSHTLPTFRQSGRTYVMGSMGERYLIHLNNPTPRRVEAVVSVDGLDSIDGRPADFESKRGYVIPAYGDVTVEGFRTSLAQVAAFRFSSVADSYAGRKGSARDVGVIGVAFFPERVRRFAPLPEPLREGFREEQPRTAPSPSSPPRDSSSGPEASAAPPAGEGADKHGNSSRRLERPGLGTEFGERRASHMQYTTFERDDRSRPASVVELRYNDRRGLLALGVAVDGCRYDDLALRETAQPFRGNRFSSPPPPR